MTNLILNHIYKVSQMAEDKGLSLGRWRNSGLYRLVITDTVNGLTELDKIKVLENATLDQVEKFLLNLKEGY